MGVWLQTDEVECRGCRRIIDAQFNYCPNCGMYVMRRGQRVYQEARIGPGLARNLRTLGLILLEGIWTVLVFMVGATWASARP